MGFGNPVCMFAADKPRWEKLSLHAKQQIINYCDEQRLQNPHFGTRAEQQFVHTAINQQQQYGGTTASAITLSTDSEEDSDDEPPPRIVKLRQGLSRNDPTAAAQPEAEPAAEPAATRVSKRQRKQPTHYSREWEGGYQDLETQRKLAAEERHEYSHLLEVRADQHGGRGLFAKRDLDKGDIKLSYFGKHYPGESFYLKDYPGATTDNHNTDIIIYFNIIISWTTRTATPTSRS